MNRIIFAVLGISLCFNAASQQLSPFVFSSTGGHFQGGQHQMSFTLGETVIATHSTQQNTLTQGFHQSRLQVISLNEYLEQSSIKVYPNPTTDLLFIKTDNLTENARLTLYSSSGKTIISQNLIPGKNEELTMSHLAAGTYLLHLVSDNTLLETFQIIKTH